MTTEDPPLADLGRTVRALRREADLSQRELARRSGVPQATIARIESGRATDPRFHTVERLVRAVGGTLTVALPAGPASSVAPATAPTAVSAAEVTCALPPVPHDELRDTAGRRYPAHLDVWPVREPKDWPGAWWADWYNLPPPLWPLRLPPAAYERNRGHRDRRRAADRVRRDVRVRWVEGDGRPATAWRFVAELPDGTLLGELRAHERDLHLVYGDDWDWPRELVLDGVLVAAGHRRIGIGDRLVAAMAQRMDDRGIGLVRTVVEEHIAIRFLSACGFRVASARPLAMTLKRPAGPAPRPPRPP
ncbi:GNAT family N-acetyltransferase [Micromonospora sp. S-DT3-3-22]|uniref:GNAT family N-acetyltransferase n=1 Tax=Micromonospora sp. S-DT3-3-22 TaxID=2755359 RepID=UPI0018903E2B|nr:GNAT family N-acetyltransferase [Micromonospora sp. S-DT3-3-22]